MILAGMALLSESRCSTRSFLGSAGFLLKLNRKLLRDKGRRVRGRGRGEREGRGGRRGRR